MSRRMAALAAVAGVLLTAGCATTPAAKEVGPVVGDAAATSPVDEVDVEALTETSWTGTMTPWDELPLIGQDAEVIIPGLPVDPHPDGDTTSLRVEVYDEVAIWDVPLPHLTADDAGHVARLAPWTIESETVLPVLEVTDDQGWGLVPLMARAGRPSEGVTGQAVGWIRLTDPHVRVITDQRVVEVDVEAQTVTVRDGQDITHEATVAVGLPDNATPAGRTGIVAAFTDPAATYAEGDILAVARYSDDLDSFTPMGASAPVAPLIAMHTWNGTRPSGQVSNGCIRLAPDTHTVLADLPVGTPVVIR